MSFDLELDRRLGATRVVLSLAPAPGVTVLVGRSGVGKTSVLNMVAGLLRPDAGHVRVGERTLFDSRTGIDLPPEQRSVGYVFQEPRLFPHRRVGSNLGYGARAAPDRDARIINMARMLDIEALLGRWPGTLSGGEAKRVAIGRALLRDPACLLFDEPLASLDRVRAEEVMRAIEMVRDETRLPILLVTHDRAEAERLGHRIVEMA